MKSRMIPTLPETILSYNIGDEKSGILSQIADSLNMEHKEIPLDKAGESVGFLAGFSGFSSNGSEITDDGECVIFSGIEGKKLDVLLKKMRAAGLVIPLKAIVTAHNQSQSVKWLIAELTQEHEAMKAAAEKKG